MPITPPTHRVERSIRATTGARVVAGIDEVGRGAWAGPVTVCAAVTGLRRPPEGLTDSKLLTVKRRTELAAVLDGWVSAHALGHSSPEEIDELGMTAALRLASLRALEALPVRPDAVILDGKHDYLGTPWQVRTVIKGDQSCVSVAAASVLAKVRRDALMANSARHTPTSASATTPDTPRPCTRRHFRRWADAAPPHVVGLHGRPATLAPPQAHARRPGPGDPAGGADGLLLSFARLLPGGAPSEGKPLAAPAYAAPAGV